MENTENFYMVEVNSDYIENRGVPVKSDTYIYEDIFLATGIAILLLRERPTRKNGLISFVCVKELCKTAPEIKNYTYPKDADEIMDVIKSYGKTILEKYEYGDKLKPENVLVFYNHRKYMNYEYIILEVRHPKIETSFSDLPYSQNNTYSVWCEVFESKAELLNHYSSGLGIFSKIIFRGEKIEDFLNS